MRNVFEEFTESQIIEATYKEKFKPNFFEQLIYKLGPTWYEQSILDKDLKMRLALEAADAHQEF